MTDKPVSPDFSPTRLCRLAGRPEGTHPHRAQQRAALAVNRELVNLYWQIGREILARQAE